MRPEELDQRCAELKARMAARYKEVAAPRVGPKLKAPHEPTKGAERVEQTTPHHLPASAQSGMSRGPVGHDGSKHLANTHGFDISVSAACRERALSFMTTLLGRLEHAGMRVAVEKLEGEKGRATWVYVDNEKIGVRLREVNVRIEREPSASEKKRRERDPTGYWFREYDWKPTGNLAFALLSNGREVKKWSDEPGKRLEDRVNLIIGGLQRTADRERRHREAREAWQQLRAAEEIQRRQSDLARQDIAKRIEDLNRDAELWHQSKRIRAYLLAFQEKMEKWSGPIDSSSETAKWLEWARRYADRLDPLVALSE